MQPGFAIYVFCDVVYMICSPKTSSRLPISVNFGASSVLHWMCFLLIYCQSKQLILMIQNSCLHEFPGSHVMQEDIDCIR